MIRMTLTMQDMRILFLAKLFGQMVKFANAGVAAAADLGAGASVGNSIPVLSGTHKCGSNGDYADSDIGAKSGGQCVERDSGAGTGNPRAEAGTDANTDVRASASDANARKIEGEAVSAASWEARICVLLLLLLFARLPPTPSFLFSCFSHFPPLNIFNITAQTTVRGSRAV